jgi:putative ABC transport system permease protein
MFDYDKWQEIFSTIKKNKLRTFLTVVGIGSGMFMLILLLGFGNSLSVGVMQGFNFTTNSGFLWGRKATISYNGFQPGRFIRFDNSDTEMMRTRIREIKYLAPRNSLGSVQTNYQDKFGSFQIFGDYPDYNLIEIKTIDRGRFINQKDIDDYRKVAVIGLNVKNVLFGEDGDPIGKFISVRKVNFMVVGVIKPPRGNNDNEAANSIHVPFSTFQRAFNTGKTVGWYGYSLHDNVPLEETETKIIAMLKEKNNIHPLDEDAVGHFNLQLAFNRFQGLFTGIERFVWFVSIATLFAGIIGVSNIMLIIVKERTKEIGIRKSLGATPNSIISLIIQESVFLTLLGGYFAMIVGLLLLELVASAMAGGSGDMPFAPPAVEWYLPVAGLGILVLGGMIAGIIPARKAAAISPVEAIRSEG